MLVNATLIPFFLGIFTNVSKESDFDPEYLFEMNKLTVKYEPYNRGATLSSRITCHPFQTDSLRCFMHDITHMTSINRTLNMNNRVEIEQWFEMKFFEYNRGIQDVLVTEKEPTKFVKSFIKDVIHQFNIGPIEDIGHVKDPDEGYTKDGYIGLEKTPIGKCVASYVMNLGRFKRHNYEKTHPNFQIRLLNGPKFDQKDIYVRIEKDRDNCAFSMPYAKFIDKGAVTSYLHIIEIISNSLRIYTTLNGYQSKKTWDDPTNELFYFSHILDFRLINITAQKTISFKDYNSTKFDY